LQQLDLHQDDPANHTEYFVARKSSNMITALLTPKERNDVGRLLRSRREALSRTIDRELHAHGGDEVQATANDGTDWATADTEANDALTKLEHDSKEIEALDYALYKFETSEFGECENCGSPIGFPRLLAHPTARLCLSCQTRFEANHRKNAGD
jgi:DnaK suppressor protein